MAKKKIVKAETKAENTEVKVDVRKELSEVESKLMDFIPENEKGTDRADCLERILEATADENKTDEELSALLEEGKKFLAVETEKKKEKKKSLKKSAKEEEATEDAEPVEEPKTPKKPLKEDRFEFPEELKNEDETYAMAEVKKVADVKVGDLIACEWTERQLRKYNYDTTGVLGQPTKFEQDIDVLVVVSVVEDKLVWGQSVGTGLMFHFLNEDFKKMDSVGMPFRVYKLAK